MTPRREPNWRAFANCATTDPEIFFPEKGGSGNPAKRVCAECTVTTQCLTYALQNEFEFGIYADTNPAARRRMKRSAA